MISIPSSTFSRTSKLPVILPTMLTGLAGLISLPLDMGVGPKNRHKACPGGQYPMSPLLTVGTAFSSSLNTGIPK